MLVYNQEPLEDYDIAFQDDLQKEILFNDQHYTFFTRLSQYFRI